MPATQDKALWRAARRGDAAEVREALAAGGDAMARDAFERVALHHAVARVPACRAVIGVLLLGPRSRAAVEALRSVAQWFLLHFATCTRIA